MLWVKVFHLIFMVSWFAGLFYLPRLFVYHVETSDSNTKKLFTIMEKRLYLGIMTPAMVLTVATGLWMAFSYAFSAYSSQLWLHVKLGFAVGLLGYHFLLGRWRTQLANEHCKISSRGFRLINEVPLLFLFVMIALVILKPF